MIQKVNETFQDLRVVQKFAGMWLNEISPAIKSFLNQLDLQMLENVTENPNFPLIPGLDDASSLFTNISDKIEE